jgi:hypothetical protein
MPNEGDKRPCPKCKGTQVYKSNAAPIGSQAGVETKSGHVAWGRERGPGWICEKDREHFDAS